MAINLNTNPYYDDFNSEKNYVQVLFKPSLPVQARELTQLQTILNRQIEKFGNHIFANGSIVIPGNSFLDTNARFIVVKQHNAVPFSSFTKNKILVGLTTGVRAIIRHIEDLGNNLRIYVNYISAGTNGEIEFEADEILQEENVSANTLRCETKNYSGIGSLFAIEKGVFYINGFFVSCDRTILEVATTDSPSAQVVFRIEEKIIDSKTDQTLLDPAQGSYNYAAPGADRYKINLIPEVKDFNFLVDKNYVLLLKVEEGRIRYHADAPKYSELERSLARRTYDESGNYIVEGLQLKVIEDKSSISNEGRSESGDPNKLCYVISSGKAYIQGFETRNRSEIEIPVDKARTASHTDYIQNVNIRPSFGNYIYVTNLKGLPNFSSHEKIEIFNTSVSGGTKIGEANVFDIDYLRDDIASGKAIYKLYLRDILLFTGSVQNIRITNQGSGYTTAPVVTISPPPTGGKQATATAYVSGGKVVYIAITNPGYGYVTPPTVSLSGGSGSGATAVIDQLKNYDIRDAGRINYTAGSATVVHKVVYQRQSGVSFTEGETIYGSVDTFIPPGGASLPPGVSGNRLGEVAIVHTQYPSEGVLFLKRTNSTAQYLPIVGSSTVGETNTSTNLKILSIFSKESNGQSALLFKIPLTFTKTIRDKDNAVKISYYTRKVGTITTNSSGNGSLTVNGGVIESLEQSSFVAVTATGVVDPSLFSINTAGTTLSITGGPINTNITVYYDIRKTNVIERTKTPLTNVQTGLTVVNNIVQLNKADIFELTSVISDTLGDVTNLFELDNGQRDTHYQNGRLIAKQVASFGKLTVTYKYYQHSASGDYFTVDSYTGLGADYYTKIGRYRSETDGIEYYLKDYFDFRKIVTDSAELPANGKVVTFDAQNFLSRIDLVVLNKNGEVFVKTGIPSVNPKAKEVSENEVAIATVQLNPYTRSLRDIVIKDISVRRYTMENIKQLERRLQDLEEFSLLNSLEKTVIDEEIVDAETGLSRYKTGYLVDGFKSITDIADISDPDFKVLYEILNGDNVIRPQQAEHEIPFVITNSSNVQVTGKSITLPYTLKKLAEQSLSSRLVNLNPYLFSNNWEGVLTLFPNTDSWVETIDIPTIFRERTENVEITTIVWVPLADLNLHLTAPDWRAPRVTDPLIIARAREIIRNQRR